MDGREVKKKEDEEKNGEARKSIKILCYDWVTVNLTLKKYI